MTKKITMTRAEFNAIQAALANAERCITDRDDYTMDEELAEHCRDELAHVRMVLQLRERIIDQAKGA